MEYYTCTYEHVLHGQGLCKEGWLKHADHCYFFNQSAATWTNAKVFQFGGGDYELHIWNIHIPANSERLFDLVLYTVPSVIY